MQVSTTISSSTILSPSKVDNEKAAVWSSHEHTTCVSWQNFIKHTFPITSQGPCYAHEQKPGKKKVLVLTAAVSESPVSHCCACVLLQGALEACSVLQIARQPLKRSRLAESQGCCIQDEGLFRGPCPQQKAEGVP